MEKIDFSEEQKFDSKWLWLTIGVLLLIPIILTLFVKKGIFISILITVPVIVLLLLMKLKTEIGAEGIRVKFFPIFIFDRLIKWDEIDQIYIRKYKPITEYGGWGVRISYKHGVAYNVKGNKGIQIVFKNDRQLLIGTQKTDEAESAILKYKSIHQPQELLDIVK